MKTQTLQIFTIPLLVLAGCGMPAPRRPMASRVQEGVKGVGNAVVEVGREAGQQVKSAWDRHEAAQQKQAEQTWFNYQGQVSNAKPLPTTPENVDTYCFTNPGQQAIKVQIASDHDWTCWVMKPVTGTTVNYSDYDRTFHGEVLYSNGFRQSFEDKPGVILEDFRTIERNLPRTVRRAGVRFKCSPETAGMTIVVYFNEVFPWQKGL